MLILVRQFEGLRSLNSSLIWTSGISNICCCCFQASAVEKIKTNIEIRHSTVQSRFSDIIFSDNLRFSDSFQKTIIYFTTSIYLHYLVKICDKVTFFAQTKSVTKSRVHCTSNLISDLSKKNHGLLAYLLKNNYFFGLQCHGRDHEHAPQHMKNQEKQKKKLIKDSTVKLLISQSRNESKQTHGSSKESLSQGRLQIWMEHSILISTAWGDQSLEVLHSRRGKPHVNSRVAQQVFVENVITFQPFLLYHLKIMQFECARAKMAR